MKTLISVGVAALLFSSLHAFDYTTTDGFKSLGAVADIEDFSIFDDKCINFVYQANDNTGGVTGLHNVNMTLTGYPLLTKISKGESFLVHSTGSCTFTLPTEDNSSEIRFGDNYYGTVTSPTTGRVWLDRDIGADKVCEHTKAYYNDDKDAYIAGEEECFGDYFQWGRNISGHELQTSNTTTIRQPAISINTQFVIASPENHGDWSTSSLSQRVSNWQRTDGDDELGAVCPEGFRVPTTAEFNAEATDISAFIDTLKIAQAGHRIGFEDNNAGETLTKGYFGSFWTSSISDVYPDYPENVNIGTNINFDQDHAATGRSIRCIKAQ